MSYSLEDTIVAVASPAGGGLRGIIRLAGPQVWGCLARCFLPYREIPEELAFLFGGTEGRGISPVLGGKPGEKPPLQQFLSPANETRAEEEKPFCLSEEEAISKWLASFSRPVILVGELRVEASSRGLPCELYCWPGPRSYTGGPQAEIHTLGSPPLLEAAVRSLCLAGARLAEPGEFTFRAFLSGRMDLTQAEAVLGVVDAASSQQLAIALEQLAGGLARPLHELRNQLLELLVHLEVGLDFPEEDLPFLTPEELVERIQQAERVLGQLAEQLQTRRISSEGIRVVLVGRPNAGKSSLFNALLGRPGAIVSPWPGTTRDYLLGQLELEGLRCQLVDTAGLDWVEVSARELLCGEAGQFRGAPQAEGNRSSGSLLSQALPPREVAETQRWPISVEAMAQQISLRQIQEADLLVWCVDGSRPLDPQEAVELGRFGREARLVVVTKADVPMQIDLEQLAACSAAEPILTSSQTGQGLEELRRRLKERLEDLISTSGHAVAATAVRSAESIRLANEAIARALALARQTGPEELIAAELRRALDEIGKVSGAVYSEDLLERIFSRFCIGK